MNYKDALAQAKKAKPEDNYVAITIGYTRLILPSKDALKFMESLVNAEQADEAYGTTQSIKPVDQDAINIQIMSATQYLELKAAQLLGIKRSDLMAMKEEESA